MRREKDLNVDVSTHATRARERTNGTGRLRDAKHLPQPAPSDNVTLWQRVKALLPTPEELTVAGRAVKGLVVTPTMGLTIILAIATMMGGLYWRMSDQIEAKDTAYQQQRDMLIEIKTELKLSKEHEAEARQRLEQQIGDLAAWQQVTNKDLARVIPNRKPQN